MTFGNSFPKVGTWLASSANLFVRWFLKIVTIFLPNNKPALTTNDTTAAGGIELPAIRQEVKKFIQYASGSWVESLIAIGAIFVSTPTGKCAEIFDRKNVIVCLTITFVFSWTTIYVANDVWMIFVARLIAGSVIFTFASSHLMNRAGRRVLRQISDFVMATCLGTLAFYFWLQEYGVDVSSFKLIPFISLGLYVSTFALGLGPTPDVMIDESFSPEIKGLLIGTLCVLDSLIEFCVVNTHQMLEDVEVLYRRFAVVFQPSVVMDSPAPREVAVVDVTTGARLGALEDAVRSLLVADAPRSIEDRLDALEDAVRSLSGQLAALGANREPTKQQAQARTATPSTWCYYHTKYGKGARKCGNVLCTFVPKILNQNQTFKKSHV